MLTTIRYLTAPLSSLFIMLLSNGLYSTLVSVRLNIENASDWMIGLASSAYYAGFTIGCFQIEHFINRVGHIRAFAIFAALLTIASLLSGMISSHITWIVMRWIAGFSIAGIYIVIESWVLASTTPKNRGRVVSIYMIALYGGQSLGQLLLNIGSPREITQFCIASILAALAMIPVCLTYRTSPEIDIPSRISLHKLYHLSPTGMLSCIIAGMILASIYGLLPVYVHANADVKDVSITMLLVILGGMSLQYPIGHLSDIIDRAWVMVLLTLSTLILSLLIPISITYSKILFWVLIFTLGGTTFTLYPISISHTCDRVKKENLVGVISALVLAYGIGATLGPMCAPLFIKTMGENGLFIYFASLSFFLASFMLWRWGQRPRVSTEDQTDYALLTQVTPVVSESNRYNEEE